MSWKKYFTSVDNSGLPLNVQGTAPERGVGAATSRYASWLPEVYAGSPNRLMRYIQYDQMDNDLEINAALDTIGEFGTQEDDQTEIHTFNPITNDLSFKDHLDLSVVGSSLVAGCEQVDAAY